jgi:conjugal transfer ATP-binding protein TraC
MTSLEQWKTTLGLEKYSSIIPILDEFTGEDGQHAGYILEGGYLGSSWLCPPSSGYGANIISTLDSIFKKKYPEGTVIQFSLVACDDLVTVLDNYKYCRGNRNRFETVIDTEITTDYMVDYYKALADTSIPSRDMEGVPLRNFEVWASIKVPIKKAMPANEEVDDFLDIANNFEGSLQQIFGYCTKMNPEILINRLQMIHNPSPDAVWRRGVVVGGRQGSYKPTQPIRNQLLESGTEVRVGDRDHMVIEAADGTERYIQSVSIKEFPDNVYQGTLHLLTGDWLKGEDGAIPGNFMVNLVVEMSPKKVSKEYSKRRVMAKQIGEGPWARWISSLKYGLQDFEYYEHYLEREKAQHCRFHLNFQMWSDSLKSVKNNSKKLITRMEGYSWSGGVDSMIGRFTWLNCLPMCTTPEVSDFIERFDFLPSNLVKFFVPMVASWAGNAIHRPILTYIARDGQLMTFDPLKSDSNYNIFITATSGAGKSVSANYLVEGILSTGQSRIPDAFGVQQGKPDGGRVFIIDSGRSYVKTTELYAGQFVEVLPDNRFIYNLCPFKSIDESQKDGDDSIQATETNKYLGAQGEMLLNILKLMAFPLGDCDSYQFSQMSVLLMQLWNKKGRESSIDDFADLCATHPRTDIQQISEQLTPWCYTRGGQNSWMFNPNKPPIQFEKDLVVLELDGLNGSDQLKAVCIMLCIQRIQQEMFRHDQLHIVKAFFLDEAWEFLKENKGVDEQTRQVLQTLAKFLESGWRRFRKYGSFGVCISQSMKDANESPAGIAMASNSAHLFYLMQNAEELTRLNNDGKFIEQDYLMLRSIRTVRPHFSEVMICSGGMKSVGRLYLPRAKALTYSTAPDEKSKIENMMKEHGIDMFSACQKIAEQEGLDLVGTWRKRLSE